VGKRAEAVATNGSRACLHEPGLGGVTEKSGEREPFRTGSGPECVGLQTSVKVGGKKTHKMEKRLIGEGGEMIMIITLVAKPGTDRIQCPRLE